MSGRPTPDELLAALAEEARRHPLPDLDAGESPVPTLDAAALDRIESRALDALGPPKSSRGPATLLFIAAPVLALAASLALVLWPGDPLPEFELRHADSVAKLRGADTPSERWRLNPDGQLHLTLTPATAVEEALELRAWLMAGGQPRQLPVAAEISELGRVEVDTPVAALALPPGPSELVFTLARPGKSPGPAELQATERGEHWRRYEVAIEVVSP